MDDALDRLNKATSDISDRLSTLLSNANNSIAHKKQSLRDKVEAYNDLHLKLRNTNLKTIEKIEIHTEIDEKVKKIATAFKNLNKIKNLSLRSKNIEDEIKEFYDLMENLNNCYERYCKIEEFCLQMDDARFFKIRIDFLSYFLKFHFFEIETTSDFVKVVKNEEEKDEYTKISKENMGNEDSIEGYLAKIYRHYRKRTPICLREKVESTMIDTILGKIQKEPFVAIDYLNQVFMLPDFFKKTEMIDKIHTRIVLDENDPLHAILFQDSYIATLQSNLIFKPQIIREKDLVDCYVKSCAERINEWFSRIRERIITNFIIRNTEPGTDEESKFVSIDFINLFELIKNQIEPVVFKGSIWKKIVSIIVGELKNMGIEHVIEKELDGAVKLKSKPGYEEYVIMISNSCFKVAQCLDDAEWANCYGNNTLKTGFFEIFKFCDGILGEFIIKTCVPVTSKIFSPGHNITKMIATIEDFLTDYSTRMVDYTFYDTVLILVEKITRVYFKQMVKKESEINIRTLRSDYDNLKRLFCSFIDSQRVVKKMEPLFYVIPLLEVNTVDLFITEVRALKIRYFDLTKDFCKNIISKKKIGESTKSEMRRRLKEVFGESKSHVTVGFFQKLFS